MPENEIGRFGLGILVSRREDGSLEYQTQSVNQGVPIEIVIMQLKAFINKQEKDYFDEFDSGTK